MSEKAIYILAGSIIIAGLLSGGIYEGVSATGGQQWIYRVNKLTGDVVRCNGTRCSD